MAVGELNTLSGKSGLAGTVGVASVKKSCHSEFLEEIQVPVPWPGESAPHINEVNVVRSLCCLIFIAIIAAFQLFSTLQS